MLLFKGDQLLQGGKKTKSTWVSVLWFVQGDPAKQGKSQQ